MHHDCSLAPGACSKRVSENASGSSLRLQEEEKNIIKCGPKPECLIEGRIRIQKGAGCCWGTYTIAYSGGGSSATQLLCGLAFLLLFFLFISFLLPAFLVL